MGVGDDFKVSRRYREDVQQLASTWRASQVSRSDNRVDVVRLLEDSVLPSLARQGRDIELTVVDDDRTEPLAWVHFGKMELCVQKGVWSSALRHEGHGRLVLAHEMGHLILHADQEYAFSSGQTQKLNFLDPTESAECQANWFASGLLVPDQVLRSLAQLDDGAVATLTLVSEQVIRVRRRELSMDKRYRNYTGDECGNCGGMTIIRGTTLVCDSCGTEFGSL